MVNRGFGIEVEKDNSVSFSIYVPEISILTEPIEIDLNQIKLTNKGLDFANMVWEEFV